MSNGSGYATKAAIKLAQAWGNSWAAAVDTLIPFVSESMTQAFDELRSEALIGQAAMHPTTQGTEIVVGDIVLDLTYGVATQLLGYGFGGQTGGAIVPANDLSAKTFNLEIEKVNDRYRFYACMVNSITISGSMGDGKPVQVTLGLIAQKADIVSTAFPTLSLPTDGTEERVYMEHARAVGFWAGDLVDALVSGDEIGISSFEFAMENNLKADDKDSVETSVVQPIRDGFRTVTSKIGLPRFTTTEAAFPAWRAADTNLQAKLVFTGDGADTVTFFLPNIKISEGGDFNVGGPGVIAGDVGFEAFYNGSGGAAQNAFMSVVDQAAITFSAV
jgi:hypothetical protein